MSENEIMQSPPPAEFEGGNSRILFFAPEGGFKLKPDKNLRRRDNLDIPFPAAGINQGNRGEVEFQNKQNEAAKAQGRNRNVNPLRSPDFKTKVGVLNLRREGNSLIFDTKPSTFVMYNDDQNVGIAKPENESIRKELGEPLAVAIILFTTEPDGSSKMVVQHRGTENRSYKDMVGASAAGFVDQDINRLDEANTATLKPVDDEFIKGVAAKETEEEDGIDPEHLKDVQVTGISEDLKRIHYEALLTAKVDLSADQIEKVATEKKTKERAAFDFSENFFVIDATPEAIAKLLTEVKCPIPPTHGDAFVAAGRLMVLQRDGEKTAKKWTQDLERDIKKNNAEIDRLAKESTGAAEGYNPRLAPQEQGLPDIVTELRRTGLIE